MITAADVLKDLQALSNPAFKVGLALFGIKNDNALGIKLPVLQQYAKPLKKNHPLALELWETQVHEARLLAIFLANPKEVSEPVMEQWVSEFNSWDICDQACARLFIRTPWAYNKANEWTSRTPEFEKRAGFVMMATLAVHDKKAPDNAFTQFFPLIEKEACDERNFVKKAINWALRQIGKRNLFLNQAATTLARRLYEQPNKNSRWIAAGALRELANPTLTAKLQAKANNNVPV